MFRFTLFLASVAAMLANTESKHCGAECLIPASNTIMEKVMPEKSAFFDRQDEILRNKKLDPLGENKCTYGMAAGEYPCKNIDLLGFLPYASMGSNGTRGNDVWGWTDPLTGREYALAGLYYETAIVDVTGGNMVPIARVPRAYSRWSDIKVYKNHMYIGTEGDRAVPDSGLGIQVFDLTRIRGMTGQNGIVELLPDIIYIEGIVQSHNVVINEETGYLYVVGSRATCAGGLHIVDIRSPAQPKFAGCFSEDGYTHDAQCVVYKGPHKKYQGREICFNFNEDTVAIVDVTDKENIKLLSNSSYPGSAYTHQGWATEDHKYLLHNDELDEVYGTNPSGQKTHTFIWDITDLENPIQSSAYISNLESIDHNMYIKGKKAYLSNYSVGLRILDINQISEGKLEEVAFFDVHPEADAAIDPATNSSGYFTGSWSSYVYFESGNILINTIDRGLFLVRPCNLAE